jgi:hypothetical protein
MTSKKMNMKRMMYFALTASLVWSLSFVATSCKDDDKTAPGESETEVTDDRYTEEAAEMLTCVSLLCGIDELPVDWRTATFTPTVGEVADETRPTERTVYVANREEAARKFLSLIPTSVEMYDVDMTSWQHDVLGTLTFNYVWDGPDGLLATVDVKSPRIPQLEQIRYVSSDAMPNNGDHFKGLAYYQLGDVVKETTAGGNDVYWICVRPAHPTLHKESHWVSLSYDDRRVKHYSSTRYPNAYIPKGLGSSDEHLTNFCQMLYFMRDPVALQNLMITDASFAKGLGGMDGLYDEKYMTQLADDWQRLELWGLMPGAVRSKLDNLLSSTTDTLSFYVNGYHGAFTKYLKVDKSIANRNDHFVTVTNTSDQFTSMPVDFRPGWQNGTMLVMQYREGSQLQSNVKGDSPFDAGRYTTIYRYREHHDDLGNQQIVNGRYGPFEYKTISATGDSVVLSGMMGWPDDNVAKDILVGCHVTITNNPDAPTLWSGSIKKETNLLLDHLHKKDKPGYNCLVVIPDYEGYGNTVGTPHPYLCQEVTAHQVADAALAARKLFHDRGGRFADDCKTITVGYSQGGSVAMATQRYIEERPDIKMALNYCGAVCGDGPYDPLATFESYFTTGKLYMPVVMPLVLISYCTYDPDMRRLGCRLEDFLTDHFLASGIVEQVKQKKLHTKEIKERLQSYVKRNPTGFHPGKDTWWYLQTSDVVKQSCIDYFNDPDGYNGENREKYEALRNALIRNCVWGPWSQTDKWVNTTNLALFHSTRDEVVPFVNYTNAKSRLQNMHGWQYNSTVTYGHIYTGCWFYLKYEIKLVKMVLEQDYMDEGEETVGGILF